ncbi:MAG: CRTAC1 family protein [Planctomycetota bacterium]
MIRCRNKTRPPTAKRCTRGILCRLCALASFLVVCGLAAAVESSIQLTDITTQTGISFIHRDGSCGDYNILETVTAGLALFDYDNDGDDDIYFVNGGTLKGTAYPSPPTNMLYRNDGNWKFTDVTAQSDAGDTSHGLAVAAADYDNDGDLDLYVSNYGPNVLYRNNGNGTFTDVTQQADVVGTNHVGAGVCFLDADGDGNLDLFVSDYVAFEYNAFPVKKLRGFPIYPGPKSHRPTTDRLYRNNGNGTFTDISRQAGFEEQAGYGMGTVCLDYDDDGDTDIVVANDEIGNFLFRNDSKGRFEEVGLISGLAYDVWGSEMGNMGVDCGDYDNDGRLDLYMTSYQDEYTALYRNLGDGMFEDVTLKTQAALGTLTHVTWGTCLVDFDNDGHRDIFVACGHLHDNVEKCEDAALYHVENILYRNIGQGKFTNISAHAGTGMRVKLSSRGAAFDDLDNDGDIDAVILNSRREPTILRNDTSPLGHWLQVKLRGTKTNRDGVGARVKVVADDLVLVDEVHSGRGYQSHYGMRMHFGLGTRTAIDRIEVRWIGGGLDVFRGIAVDRVVTLVEGGKLQLRADEHSD